MKRFAVSMRTVALWGSLVDIAGLSPWVGMQSKFSFDDKTILSELVS